MANLAEFLAGKRPGEFSPQGHYVAAGDTLIFYFKDSESYGERIDELLTVYRSIATKEMVGCQIKSIRFILERLGSFGVHVQDGEVDLRLIFVAYALASKHVPPGSTLEELRNAAEISNARVPLKE